MKHMIIKLSVVICIGLYTQTAVWSQASEPLWKSLFNGQDLDNVNSAKKGEAEVVALFVKAIRGGDAKELDRVIRKNRQQLDSQDASGKSALHHAAESGDIAMLNVLFAARANAHILDKAGKKAIDYAQDEKTKRLIKGRAGMDPKDGVQPTHVDLKYGSDNNDLMNVWLVESDIPTPVIVEIHGGGFKNGRRKRAMGKAPMARHQEDKISFISIDYRFVDPRPADIQTSLRDRHETMKHIARAIQFIRSKSGEWNIDPDLMACTGGSAGAAASMWLAFHDDMADPKSSDPVLRESTRITSAYVTNVALPSGDPLNPETIRLAETTPYGRTASSRLRAFGLANIEEARPLLETPEMRKIRRDIGIIELISPDDPPVALHNVRDFDTYDGNIHNPHSVPIIKEYCDKNGVECTPLMYNTPKDEMIEMYDYLSGKLSEAKNRKGAAAEL